MCFHTLDNRQHSAVVADRGKQKGIPTIFLASREFLGCSARGGIQTEPGGLTELMRQIPKLKEAKMARSFRA